MGIITDGTGTYSIGKDGLRNYATPVSAEIDNEKLYTFDSEKGILRLSMSPEDTENLRQSFGKSLEEGIYLEMPNPFELGEVARFEGVRSIESLPKPVGQDYLMSNPEAIPQQRKTLLDKMKNYFTE